MNRKRNLPLEKSRTRLPSHKQHSNKQVKSEFDPLYLKIISINFLLITLGLILMLILGGYQPAENENEQLGLDQRFSHQPGCKLQVTHLTQSIQPFHHESHSPETVITGWHKPASPPSPALF